MTLTADLIAQQFDNRYLIPLEALADSYLGLDPETASRYARERKFEFKVFRLFDSTHAPWLTTADDLADFLERKRRESGHPDGTASPAILRDLRKGLK